MDFHSDWCDPIVDVLKAGLVFVLLGLVVGLGRAQAFGRFGFTESPEVPGLRISREGFVAIDGGRLVRLVTPSKTWRPLATSDMGQMIELDHRAFCPWKVRLNLLAPGVSLYCPEGLKLRLACASSPFVTWKEGSVSEGVPTPPTRWAVISFRDPEPPLMLGFASGTGSLKIEGKPGDWTLSVDGFSGWVHCGPLLGVRCETTPDVASLGRLAIQAEHQVDLFTRPAPELMGVKVDADLASVTATWHFDRVHVIIPAAVSLAGLGGYPVQILSPYHRLENSGMYGPMDVLDGKELQVRFPIQRVPTGRGLAVGQPNEIPLTSAAPQDIPSVVELALENLLSSRDRLTKKAAHETSDEYLTQAAFSREPSTGQQLPFNMISGVDVAAAQALLSQSLAITEKTTSDGNSLLTSVNWMIDWGTWQIWCADPKVARRASALASVAGALCTEPGRRLTAAMLQAGLSAKVGLNAWRIQHGMPSPSQPMVEPLLALRQVLFELGGPADPDRSFVAQLLSPVRVYGDLPVAAKKGSERLIVAWPAVETRPSYLTFASAFPLDVSRGDDLDQFAVVEAFGLTQIHYVPETAGECTARFRLPSWTKPLPSAVTVPAYRE